MKLTADQNGNTRCFSAKLGWKEQFDPKEIEILSAKAVPMLIPPFAVHGRRNNVIQYDISAYSTLEFYLSCILSREQFAEMLLQCIQLFLRMQQLYLNYKNLVLEPERIYVLLSDRSLHFIYLPLMNSRREASIPDFFRSLLKKASRSTYEQSEFLDKCSAWLNRPAPFVLHEFADLIQGASDPSIPVPAVGGACAAKSPLRETASAGICSPAAAVLAASSASVQTIPAAPVSAAPLQDPTRGDTCLLGAAPGATVVLGENASSQPAIRRFLVREKTGERIPLEQFPFLVGTETGQVSYCIADNAAVSRRHACFLLEGDHCLLEDQGSTNKTYLNLCALVPKVPHQLENNSRIRFANEDFLFIQEG